MRALKWAKRQWLVSDWMLYVATALVTGALTVAALELWSAKLTVPLTYWGDALAVSAHFKTVIETGWYEFQPLLGAPFGQTYNDFPTADNLNFMAADVASLFTKDWAVAMNAYYLFGFIAAALTSLWLFRRLGISKGISLAMAAAFAIAPYHFVRGESHLWLSSYFVIPLSIGIVVMVMRDQPIWSGPPKGSRWYRWLTSRAAGTFLILALTATAQSYYAVFFLILIAFAGVVRLIRTGRWRQFWGAAVAGVITAIGMLLNMLPDIVYSMINGQNPTALLRGHTDSELFALKLTQLLLPWGGHRITFLRNLRATYDDTYPLRSESPALGIIAAVGLVALFLILAYVATTVGRNRVRSPFFTERFNLLSILAALVFVCFLCSTVGGLSTIVSFFTTSLRGWNRMSIYIGLLCLAATGIIVDAGIRWVQRKAKAGVIAKRVLAALVVVVLLGVAYIDQTPEDSAKDYKPNADAYAADQAWFGEIDDVLPAGAMVLQLPYIAFPESGTATGVLSSDALLPYLHTTDIKWTAGGIKGRARSDWSGQLGAYSPEEIAKLAAAAGFSGIHIDRSAMGVDAAAPLEAGLEQYLGAPLVSANERYSFFDLRDELAEDRDEFSKAQLAEISDRLFEPITLDASSTFAMVAGDDGTPVNESTAKESIIGITNPSDDTVPSVLSMSLRVDGGAAATITVTLPDGTSSTVPLVDGVATYTGDVEVGEGLNTVTITVAGSSGSPLQLQSLQLRANSVAAFLAE